MQKSYSKEFKESVIKKMMPPNLVCVPQLCKETGVSDVTPSLTSTKKHIYESIYYRVLVFCVINLRVIYSLTDQFFGSTGSRVNL